MRGQIEAQIGKKFDYYQPLVYRRAPYTAPIPGGGPGPQLIECDYIIKVDPIMSYHYLWFCIQVSTKPYTECIHISVHYNVVAQNSGQSLNAFQLTLPLNADLEPIFLPELFVK